MSATLEERDAGERVGPGFDRPFALLQAAQIAVLTVWHRFQGGNCGKTAPLWLSNVAGLPLMIAIDAPNAETRAYPIRNPLSWAAHF